MATSLSALSEPQPVEPLLAEHARGLAELAFGSLSGIPDLTQARHLALLPPESLELDLSDPAQRQFGDYELLELIGEGGMGVVYRARQLSLDREVAVKLLSAGPWASREFIARFEREAQNAARMQHPGIVTIYDVGSFEGMQFFSMRLVDGESLSARLRRGGRFTPREAAALMRTVAEAVGYAHSLGVLHLDLKPANVLLDAAGQPYVADFGLARRLENALAVDNDEVSGTPTYMAPEQAEVRAGKLTAATDIWGLGAILYELLTSRPLFRADTAQDTVRLVLEAQVRAPRRWCPALPLDLQAIVMRCLARDPRGRYPSARALADDLQRYLEGRPVQARPLSAMQKVWRWTRREPRLAVAVLVAFGILAGGLAATTLQWQRAQANAERSQAVRDFLVGVFGQVDPDESHGRPITAHQLLDKGAMQIARHAPADPGTRADLLGLLGKLYWDIGDYPRAESLLQGALASAQHGQAGDRVMAGLLLDQASVQNEQNKYNAAIDSASRALLLLTRGGAAAAGDASEARRQIAHAEIGSGNAAQAEQLLRATLAGDRARSGAASRAVADDKVLLGEALLEQSRLDESVAMSRAAIAAVAKAYGTRHDQMLTALGNLGVALRTQGKYQEAEKDLREAVRIATVLYGPDHSTTLSARSDMLLALDSEGRDAEALQERLAMLPAQSRLVATHPEILAYAYKNIAGEQLALGRFAAAQASAEKALQVWRNLQGSDTEWHSVAARNSLALALQYQGRYAEAEKVMRGTLAIQQQHEPAASVWLALTRGYLGNLLRLEHRATDGASQIRAALAALPPKPGPVKALLLAQLCAAELAAGDAATAQSHGAAGLAMARSVFPAGNIVLAMPLAALADADLARARAGDALPLLREALALRKAHYSADDPRVLEVEVALVRALAATGQRHDAGALHAQVGPRLAALHTPLAAELRARLAGAQR